MAYDRGTPAGYIELDGQDGGPVEIAYFGLLPAFRGRGIGGHLLSYGTARAWDLAERWPGRAPTERVWVHTCSLDGPHAMANYRRRGFRLFDTTTAEPERAGRGERRADRTVTHHTVSRCETVCVHIWMMVDWPETGVPRFRHVSHWNCLGGSTPRRPRPHVQRHLSGELTAQRRRAPRRRLPVIARVRCRRTRCVAARVQALA